MTTAEENARLAFNQAIASALKLASRGATAGGKLAEADIDPRILREHAHELLALINTIDRAIVRQDLLPIAEHEYAPPAAAPRGARKKKTRSPLLSAFHITSMAADRAAALAQAGNLRDAHDQIREVGRMIVSILRVLGYVPSPHARLPPVDTAYQRQRAAVAGRSTEEQMRRSWFRRDDAQRKKR